MLTINKPLLKSHIMRHDETQEKLAKSMGISLSCLNAKINETGNREFRQSEIAYIRDRYELSDQDVIDIFFGTEVSKTDTIEEK